MGVWFCFVVKAKKIKKIIEELNLAGETICENKHP